MMLAMALLVNPSPSTMKLPHTPPFLPASLPPPLTAPPLAPPWGEVFIAIIQQRWVFGFWYRIDSRYHMSDTEPLVGIQIPLDIFCKQINVGKFHISPAWFRIWFCTKIPGYVLGTGYSGGTVGNIHGYISQRKSLPALRHVKRVWYSLQHHVPLLNPA